VIEKENPDDNLKMSAPDSVEEKKNDRILSEYTYTVAHNLNAPLRHIIQYGELLKKEVGSGLGTDGTMYVDKIILGTKRLRGLVNDLLSYAQITHIVEKKQKQDINKIATEVIADIIPLIEETHAIVNVACLGTIDVHPFRMEQILRNLIINAITYRSAKDPVITIESHDKGKYYLFSVRDNGIGIAEKDRDVIFSALKRLYSQDKIEGSGLGLAICRAAVEAHGGRIWVESAPDEGSIFFFTISKSHAC